LSYLTEEEQNRKIEAYHKSIEADKLLANGLPGEALIKMKEAAAEDGTYEIRAEFIGKEDKRKIQVSSTVRNVIIPFLTDAGFEIKGGGKWEEGKFLERNINGAHSALLIGRDKFGHKLSVLAVRSKNDDKAEYFDWRSAGILTSSLAYSKQFELEAVCKKYCELFASVIFPWFEEITNDIADERLSL